jgi:hypothetical protein
MSDAWLPIPGYEGLYEVSSTGMVRGVARKVPHGKGNGYRNVKGRMLSASPANNGYPCVVLSKKGKRKPCTVHRLVMLAFTGPCPNGMVVAHADGNPLNPRLENLRYAAGVKLSPAQVLAIRSDARPLAKIAAEYGISKSTVFNVKNHKTYAR